MPNTNPAVLIYSDPCSSYWLKNAVKDALQRDPIDAIADAEALVALLREVYGF